jgi:TonB family protein
LIVCVINEVFPLRCFGIRFTVFAIAAISALHLSGSVQNGGEATGWSSILAYVTTDRLKALLGFFPTGPLAHEAREKYSLIAETTLTARVQKMDVRFPLEARGLDRSIGPFRTVKLNILVQRSGRAGDVAMVGSSGFDPYDRAAMAAARNATYLPAIDHGMSIDSRMDFEVSFGLVCNRAAGSPPDCYRGQFPRSCSATVCAPLQR